MWSLTASRTLPPPFDPDPRPDPHLCCSRDRSSETRASKYRAARRLSSHLVQTNDHLVQLPTYAQRQAQRRTSGWLIDFSSPHTHDARLPNLRLTAALTCRNKKGERKKKHHITQGEETKGCPADVTGEDNPTCPQRSRHCWEKQFDDKLRIPTNAFYCRQPLSDCEHPLTSRTICLLHCGFVVLRKL